MHQITPPATSSTPGAFRFFSRLERNIVRKIGEAVADFGLIEAGDHILIAVSGGKDSLAMAETLHLLRRRSPIHFDLTVVTIDQSNAGLSSQALETHFRHCGYTYQIIPAPIDEAVREKGKPKIIPCALCSRLRRGVLYTLAPKLGCNKIALGHHLDDLLETLLMNLFFSGKLRSMAPRFQSDDGRNIIIRPLCFIPEAWLMEYSHSRGFPITRCSNSGCGTEDSQRQRIKRLIQQLSIDHPKLRWHMLKAMQNIQTTHLLDRNHLGMIEGLRPHSQSSLPSKVTPVAHCGRAPRSAQPDSGLDRSLLECLAKIGKEG